MPWPLPLHVPPFLIPPTPTPASPASAVLCFALHTFSRSNMTVLLLLIYVYFGIILVNTLHNCFDLYANWSLPINKVRFRLLPSSYTGRLCDQDIDECQVNPCRNGGTCTQGAPGTFSCACALGFTGGTCEEDIDECATVACLNGGVCTQPFPGSFLCNCTQSKSALLGQNA